MGLMTNIRARVRRPIQERFKAALPIQGGDRFLTNLVGKIASRPGMVERAYGEGEVFLIKGALFMSGVGLDPSAQEGIGTTWKEDAGHYHYNPGAGQRQAPLVPHGLHLPHGLFINIKVDPTSPLVLRRENGTLYLYLEDFRLFPVEFEKRPPYYQLATSTGAPMALVGPHRLQRQLLIEYNAYCQFFSQGTQCLFCGIIGEKPPYHGHYQGYFIASPEEVAEVALAAYGDGTCTEMEITGGVLPNRAEYPYILEVGRHVKARLGVDTIPNSQAVLVPPADPAQIEQLREAGWQGVAFNLEVWDRRLWPGMAPGKAALMSWETWNEALDRAVDVFGKGQVATVLVAGLEPKTSLLQGVEELARRGIYGVPLPWTPVPGSALEGHQTPTAAWHLEVVVKILDSWERHGLAAHRHSSGGLHYDDLATMRSNLGKDYGQSNSPETAGDLRYLLAIKGKLPDL